MDNYVLEDGQIIYPIVMIPYEGKNYLFYSFKDKDITDNDICIGEENGDRLLPVDEALLPILESKYKELFVNQELFNNEEA